MADLNDEEFHALTEWLLNGAVSLDMIDWAAVRREMPRFPAMRRGTMPAAEVDRILAEHTPQRPWMRDAAITPKRWYNGRSYRLRPDAVPCVNSHGIVWDDMAEKPCRRGFCMAVVKEDSAIPTWDVEGMAQGQKV